MQRRCPLALRAALPDYTGSRLGSRVSILWMMLVDSMVTAWVGQMDIWARGTGIVMFTGEAKRALRRDR